MDKANPTRYHDPMRRGGSTRLIIVALAILAIAVSAARCAIRHRRLHRYDSLILRISEREGVDPALTSAVIWRESRFDARSVGRAGEIGLMQVTRGAAIDWARAEGIESFSMPDLYDPETNITIGAWYLARALRRWSERDDPIPYALAEYNAGPSNARRWAATPGGETADGFVEAITYPSTRDYVRSVLKRSRPER